MPRFSVAFVLPALTALALCAGHAAADDAKLPKDFTAFRPDNGTGEVLVRQTKGEKSARAAFDGALDSLSTYFDGRPRVLGAMTDDNDTEVQAGFAAARGRTIYTGLIIVLSGAGDAVVGVAYDEGKAFADSKATLVALLKKNLPAAAAAPELNWQTVQLPDGAGAVRVPQGWNVNGGNGMADVTGPDGQEAHLGLACPVFTRAAVAAMRQAGVPVAGVAVCDYTDPETAMKRLAPDQFAAFGMTWKFKGLIGKAPAPYMPGNGACLLFDADVTVNGKTKTYRSLAVVAAIPGAAGEWTYYFSFVASPAETFDRNLPTLLKVWQSWKTDPRVFAARLKKAADDMKEIGRIIEDVNDYRQHVMDRAVDDWDEYIRGTSQVLDRRDGTLTEAPYYDLKEKLEKLNEHEGYERWKVIPLKDVNNP